MISKINAAESVVYILLYRRRAAAALSSKLKDNPSVSPVGSVGASTPLKGEARVGKAEFMQEPE